MILEIPAIVSALVPELVAGQPVSVACVHTSRPIFLVFGGDAGRPICVVQFGPRDELERVDGVLSRLHGLLPGQVPAPLVCAPWRDGDGVLIQSGLPGLPWFRLAHRIRRREDWIRLQDRALEALGRFHAAIRKVPDWCHRIAPGDELRRRIEDCRVGGVQFSARALDLAAAWADDLDGLGALSCPWQHGDFCLNNLLIADSGLGIIDFEEFGRTSMPLHDQFGLYLSLDMFSRGRPGTTRLSEVIRSTSPRGAILPVHIPGLFLHHLLWRIGRGLGRAGRGRLVALLTGMVEEFVASPREYLASLT